MTIDKCPKCGSHEVEEVSDGVVERHFWAWNKEQNKFIWNCEDSENYGDYFLRCPECDYRYSQEKMDKFGDIVAYETIKK